MAAHGVVRTDRLAGTDVRSYLVSAKYMGSGSTATAIDNGAVVKLDGLMSNEREIFKAVTPAAGDALGTIGLVASPETFKDGLTHDLNEFENKAGKVIRVYKLHAGDIFSLTAEAIDGTADVGSIIELQAATKLKAISSATQSSTGVGKVIDKETTDGRTYYGILVG